MLTKLMSILEITDMKNGREQQLSVEHVHTHARYNYAYASLALELYCGAM